MEKYEVSHMPFIHKDATKLNYSHLVQNMKKLNHRNICFTVSGFSILSHEKKMASIPSGFPFKRQKRQCVCL